MAETKPIKFHGRSFTSFFSTFSFLIMTITGIILYFAPPGRIAHWSYWKFLAMTKEQWQALHTIFSLAFIIIAGVHIYYNWSVLIGYFKKKMRSGISRKKELLGSSILTIALTIFTIAGAPPFSTIMDWGESLSDSWSNRENEPPTPHAESMTLIELSSTLQISFDEMLKNLETNGIKADSANIIVEDLAGKYKLTPSELFKKMNLQNENSRTNQTGSGFGYGRKTVTEVCQELNVSIEVGMARLKEKGIDAGPKDKVRDLAMDHNLVPMDIVTIIKPDSTEK